ncbi:hypothetical protein [Nocardia mexicana]|uniref:Uncharacterized protein n=1 Tax=Nocardia mexicana TaxID=279262 RepID=A0A370HEU1_9NOCA|nr:hypothetical protein [Nocardia mexicana]RDI55545.1 hypothetical protein DFR68_101378 [Nocardia mexicana]
MTGTGSLPLGATRRTSRCACTGRILVADIEYGVSGTADTSPARRTALGTGVPHRALVIRPLRISATGRTLPLGAATTGRWPGVGTLRARTANRRTRFRGATSPVPAVRPRTAGTRFRRLVPPTTNPALALLAPSMRGRLTGPIGGVRLHTPRMPGMATTAARIGHHRELIGIVVHLAVQFHITVLWGS